MKLMRNLLLIAIALIVPAGVANATPTGDPSVIINRVSTGDAITFSSNSLTNPLVITLNSHGLLPTEDLDYTGSAQNNFFIALAGSLPFEQFSCQSNVFTGCDFISTVNTQFSNDVELEFLGPLNPGMFTIEVTSTPEPGTIVLLLTGGVLLIGLGRRW